MEASFSNDSNRLVRYGIPGSFFFGLLFFFVAIDTSVSYVLSYKADVPTETLVSRLNLSEMFTSNSGNETKDYSLVGLVAFLIGASIPLGFILAQLYFTVLFPFLPTPLRRLPEDLITVGMREHLNRVSIKIVRNLSLADDKKRKILTPIVRISIEQLTEFSSLSPVNQATTLDSILTGFLNAIRREHLTDKNFEVYLNSQIQKELNKISFLDANQVSAILGKIDQSLLNGYDMITLAEQGQYEYWYSERVLLFDISYQLLIGFFEIVMYPFRMCFRIGLLLFGWRYPFAGIEGKAFGQFPTISLARFDYTIAMFEHYKWLEFSWKCQDSSEPGVRSRLNHHGDLVDSLGIMAYSTAAAFVTFNIIQLGTKFPTVSIYPWHLKPDYPWFHRPDNNLLSSH